MKQVVTIIAIVNKEDGTPYVLAAAEDDRVALLDSWLKQIGATESGRTQFTVEIEPNQRFILINGELHNLH